MKSFELFFSRPLPDFNNIEKILLVGAGGKTGSAYTNLLLEQNKKVWAYDKNLSYTLPVNENNDSVSEKGRNLFLVTPTEFADASVLDKVEAVTLSPGVPLQQDIFYKALEKNIPIISELEFSFFVLRQREKKENLSTHKILSITGTDGKSTVTAITCHMLNALGNQAIACGNYGLPLSALLLNDYPLAPNTILCLELSSYQLELSRNLKSDAAIFLNLAADHLNRYPDLKTYGLAKWNIAYSLQPQGKIIINKNLLPPHPLWRPHPLSLLRKEKSFRASMLSVVDAKNLHSQNFFWQKALCCLKRKIQDKHSPLCFTNMEELAVKGRHNHANFLFALEAVYHLVHNSMRDDIFVEKIRQAMRDFHGLPHRFEFLPVGEDGNLYINDSKATTCQAVITALKNVSPPLYVFLGGKSKGEDYSVLRHPLVQAQAYVIAFGEIRFELQKVLHGFIPLIGVCEKLNDAVKIAREHKDQSHHYEAATFLFSPAATSWDAFSSFEERGDYFKKLVAEQKV